MQTDQATYNLWCQFATCLAQIYDLFSLQPEYFLLSKTAELVRWVLRNKIWKRREVLRHPCILSPPWSLFLCLGAHVPFALLSLSIYIFYLVLRLPPFHFFSLPTLILRHGGKVLDGNARKPPKPAGFVYWDYPALGFYLSPLQLHPRETHLPLPL